MNRAFRALNIPHALADASTSSPQQNKKILQGLSDTAHAVGYDTSQTIFDVLKLLVTVVLSLIGLVFLAMMLWAGFNWLTAAGDKEKVTRARDTIISSAIGIIIIVSAYAITQFVFASLPFIK